jgi:hypothetical protein
MLKRYGRLEATALQMQDLAGSTFERSTYMHHLPAGIDNSLATPVVAGADEVLDPLSPSRAHFRS